MPRRTLAVTAVLGICSYAGCQDDHDIQALVDLANRTSLSHSTSQATQTAPAKSPAGLNIAMAHRGQRMELTARGGCVEWVHKPGEASARMYFLDSDQHPIGNVTSPVMWLSHESGPIEIAMVSCQPAETGCWQAQSPELAKGLPHGLVRFEVGHEGYRVVIPIRQATSEHTDVPSQTTSPIQLPEHLK